MSQYGNATEPSAPLGSGAHGNDPAAEVGIMRVTVAPPPLQSAVVNVVIDHITHVDMSGSGQGDGSSDGQPPGKGAGDDSGEGFGDSGADVDGPRQQSLPALSTADCITLQ